MSASVNFDESSCVYLVRIFADEGINPPTTQRQEIVTTTSPGALSFTLPGLAVNDTVHVMAQVENVSGVLRNSSVISISITDSGI